MANRLLRFFFFPLAELLKFLSRYSCIIVVQTMVVSLYNNPIPLGWATAFPENYVLPESTLMPGSRQDQLLGGFSYALTQGFHSNESCLCLVPIHTFSRITNIILRYKKIKRQNDDRKRRKYPPLGTMFRDIPVQTPDRS